MRSRILAFAMTSTLLAVTAISVRLSAQDLQKQTASASSATIITFNAPRAGKGFNQGTAPQDINDAGAVTGYYQDAKNVYHGFLRTPDGTLTSFDAPSAGKLSGQGTSPQGVNASQAITGYCQDATNVYHGYLRTPAGKFTTFDVPGAGGDANQGTFGENINDTGTISGYYVDWNNVAFGFLRSADGTITTFAAPDSGENNWQGTTVIFTGMTADGAVTGSYYNDSGTHGYVRFPNGSMFPTFDVYGALYTLGESINSAETITGYYQDQALVFNGFVRTRNGVITEFKDPHAGLFPGQGTFGFAINSAKWVTGTFIDANNGYHGFVRRGSAFTTIDPAGATQTYPETINTAGAIAGFYYDTNGAYHGFLWIP